MATNPDADGGKKSLDIDEYMRAAQEVDADEAIDRGHDTGPVYPDTWFSRPVDAFISGLAQIASMLWLVLVGVIVVNVFMRYFLGQGLIVFEEIQWHIYSVGFIIGLSYVLQIDKHVRVDVLAEHFPHRRRAWIEAVGLLVFVLPFSLLVAYFALPFVERSWVSNEESIAPGGLPYRWILKSFIIWGFLLIALAALSRLTRVVAYLRARAPAA